jgi:8-oxo-dGTP diphosphatase
MVAYRPGTSPRGEIDAIKEHLALHGAAVQASPDVLEAFNSVTELGELGQRVVKDAAALRTWLAALLVDERGMSRDELATILGLTPGRIGQLIRAGRKQERIPIMDPGTLKILPPVAVAIITSPSGVLVVRRKDKTPEYSFPGGEVQVGETPADALVRRVLDETRVVIRPDTVFGQRIHPRTSRHMIYMAATTAEDSPSPRLNPDDEDLNEVRYAGLDEVRELMPDIYKPILEHLEAVLGNAAVFRAE